MTKKSNENTLTSIDTIDKSLTPIKIRDAGNIVEMINKYQIELNIQGDLTDKDGVYYKEEDIDKLSELFEMIELPKSYEGFTKHEIGLMVTKLNNYKSFYDQQAKNAAANVKKLKTGMTKATKIIDEKIKILKKAESVASAMEIANRIEMLHQATLETIEPKRDIEFKHFVLINEVSKAVFDAELLSEVTCARVRAFNDLIDVIVAYNLAIEDVEVPSTIIRALSKSRWNFERAKKLLTDKFQPRLTATGEDGEVVEASQEETDNRPFYTKVLIRTQDYDRFKQMMNRQGMEFTIME